MANTGPKRNKSNQRPRIDTQTIETSPRKPKREGQSEGFQGDEAKGQQGGLKILTEIREAGWGGVPGFESQLRITSSLKSRHQPLNTFSSERRGVGAQPGFRKESGKKNKHARKLGGGKHIL